MGGLLSILLFLLEVASLTADTKNSQEDTNHDAQNQECMPTRSAGDVHASDSSSSSVYVIGDLHGDAVCAVSWVNRTGLIANLMNDDPSSEPTTPLFEKLNNLSEWRWTRDRAKLVFMGDYVDKGPTSKQTVQFVKDLTKAFPEKVTAILGNHELELLRDRDLSTPHDRYSAYSYATVHPGEYHNYFKPKRGNDADEDERVREVSTTQKGAEPRALDEKDDLVLDLLYEASMEVYAHGAHSAVRFVPALPHNPNDHRQRGIMYAITDLVPPQHRLLARERLADYIDAYLDSFRSGTALGDWLEQRPVVYLAEDIKTLFVHGGVSHDIGKSYLSKGKEGVEKINSAFFKHNSEGKLSAFLSGKDMSVGGVMGYVVYELLTYRGNHPGYSKWESHGTYELPNHDDKVCKTLHDMLSHMKGIDRIAVGHTPDDNVRIMCNGTFLALDSTLGRWIRGSGNEYCPGPEHFENREGANIPRTSRNGRFKCEEIQRFCEGQIVRLDSDGSINVLTM